MRLLHYSSTGKFELTQYSDNDVPPYAILSHMWGPDEEEVTYHGLVNGTGKDKSGYEKIRFSGDQAKKDGLDYFWVDTCCINKENRAELSTAIQSMFLWYQRAARCYVYLSDVSAANTEEKGWKSAFRKSRWFTRGWTLQELLAPVGTVDFFSKDGVKLGDRVSLAHDIHEITGIPHLALQGGLLSRFSIQERLRWSQYRQTTVPEDKAYSLLGVLDVADFAPCYGEGGAEAFRRLHDEIQKLQRCLQDIRITDPSYDKKRIEDTKGGLMKDSYLWVLDNKSFQQWRGFPELQTNLVNPLLWIKGDPGKGKTMLLCGIIDELQTSMSNTCLLAYFFCQATDSRINNAVAVLRGLLYMLFRQQPSLVSNVRKRYDETSKSLFEDANAWSALTEIFVDVLQDPSLNATYLVIDALDECVTDLPKLLDFLAKQSQSSGVSQVRWIVSSRNRPDVEERLNVAEHKVNLSLELNAASISTAVSIFIEQKLSRLAQEKKYDDKTRTAVLRHLTSNANDTFLWVSLVCQNLETTARRNVLKKLESFPPGLDSLYVRMLQQITESDDADVCKHILAFITLVYRPIMLEELQALVEQLDDLSDDPESICEIIGFCGSFLTMRESTIYFVHQSAKDFMLTDAAEEIFPSGTGTVHLDIVPRSLQIMSETLQRNVYGLKSFEDYEDGIIVPSPDPLAASRYSCIYWVDHLDDSFRSGNNSSAAQNILRDGGLVHTFIQKKFLYWLEVLSLCESTSKGVVSMRKLCMLTKDDPLFASLSDDAYRFIMSHKWAIESSPLQVYSSALMFSPSDSIVKREFQHEQPEWLTIKPDMSNGWGACMLTLEGHADGVTSVAFLHNFTQIASASYDKTIKIWDVNSGECLQTFEGHSKFASSVAISHDSTWLVSGGWDSTVKIWDVNNGTCLHTLEEHTKEVVCVTLSHDSTLIASASRDHTAKIWLARTGECLHTLHHDGKDDKVTSVAFSHDSTQLASGTEGGIIKLWKTSKGSCLRTLKSYSCVVTCVAFSHDSTMLAVGLRNSGAIEILNVANSMCLMTLEGHSEWVNSVAFSHESTWLASASHDLTIKTWDLSSGTCLQTFAGHSQWISSVALPKEPNVPIIISGSTDSTIKIWNVNQNAKQQIDSKIDRHTQEVRTITFSPDSTRLVSGSDDTTFKIWDTSNMTCLLTIDGWAEDSFASTFSHDSSQLATAVITYGIKSWDVNSGACIQTFEGRRREIQSMAFSHDSSLLASVSASDEVKIWDTSNGTCLQTFIISNDWDPSTSYDLDSNVTFSHDSARLAVGLGESERLPQPRTVAKIWDIGRREWVQMFEGHSGNVTSVAFSHDSSWLASTSEDKTVKVWDVVSGACLQTIEVEKDASKVAFNSTSTALDIIYGTIALNIPKASDVSDVVQSSPAQFLGLHLGVDVRWILYKGKKLLWLPQEYKPWSDADARGNTIAWVGKGSMIWTCTVDPEKVPID